MSEAGTPHVLTLESPGLGDRSYVVHDGRVAIVVDPQRDIDRVERLVAEHGLTISHVVETHFHNDYVTGGLELARKHDSTYIVPAGFDIKFDATEVGDGDTFDVGDLTVEVIHTPGHTPNHMSYAVRSGDDPGVVFTGGSLLYGSVGRPDLVAPDQTEELAHEQWRSAHRIADRVDDAAAVFPTHGFGSFCSATQTQGTSSTVGREREINPAFTTAESEFVETMLAGLDVFPAYYAHMGPANVAGPPAIDLTPPTLADADELRQRIARGEWVVDLRSRAVFAQGHVPGALNFDMDGAFINYLAWMVPWGTPITLLGNTPEQVEAAQRDLVRVGIDRPAAAGIGGVGSWLDDPADVEVNVRIDFAGLAQAIAQESDPFILDTRQIREWEAGHVDGATFIPFYEVADRLGDIPRDRRTYVYCGSGYRASVVVSLLKREGFGDVVHVDDMFANAARAGLPVVSAPAPAREPGWTWIASRATAREYDAQAAKSRS